MLNSTSPMAMTDGAFIRPTPLERAMGRFMRAPDHDAGGDGAGDGASGGNGDAAGQGDGAGAGDGASDASDDDATALGSAAAEDGAGDGSEDGKEGDEGGDDDKAKADAPPETYELKVTTKDADGKDTEVEIDKALLDEATPVFKELGLSNEAANKLAPLAIKVQERMLQQQADEFATTRAAWAKEAQEDKEIGGKNWKSSLSLAAKALDHFGAPSEIKEVEGKKVETNPFRVLLNQSGLGEHPVMIRIFSNVGKALSEDGQFPRGEGAAPKKSREEVLYPEDTPKK
jgi:hypothetical protein